MGMDATVMGLLGRIDRLERDLERRGTEASWPLAWVDPRAYGVIGDGASHPLSASFGTLAQAQQVYPHAVSLADEIDWAALQATFNAAIAVGGARIYLRAGTYVINRALTLPLVDASVIVELFGDGRVATTIVQASAVTDLLKIGVDNLWRAYGVYIHDLQLQGGANGLRLNNTIGIHLERVDVSGCGVGIYGEGSNEHHVLRDVHVSGCASGGISFGNANGVLVAVEGDLPYLQKSFFEKIHVGGTTAGPALKITAGNLGGQLTSGSNVLRQIQLEDNRQHQIVLEYAFNTLIDGVANEVTAGQQLDANEVYSVIQYGPGCSQNELANALLSCRAAPPAVGTQTTFKYGVEVQTGFLTFRDSVAGAVYGASSHGDLRLGVDGLAFVQNVLGQAGLTPSIVTPGSALFYNHLNSAGGLGATWLADTVPQFGRSTNGLRTGRIGIGRDPADYPLEVAGGARLTHPSSDIGLVLDGGTATSLATTYLSRSGAIKWQLGMSSAATPAYVFVGPAGTPELTLSTTATALPRPLVLGSGTTMTRSVLSGTLANGATVDLGAGKLGKVTLLFASSGEVAECYLRGAGNAVREIFDPATILEITDTGAAWAIYHDGATYRLKNRTGASASYTLVTDLL